jgi:hypothetical protein
MSAGENYPQFEAMSTDEANAGERAVKSFFCFDAMTNVCDDVEELDGEANEGWEDGEDDLTGETFVTKINKNIFHLWSEVVVDPCADFLQLFDDHVNVVDEFQVAVWHDCLRSVTVHSALENCQFLNYWQIANSSV